MVVQDLDNDVQLQEEEFVADEETDDASIASIQYDISSYGADYDVEGLVKRLNRGDILIPSFQRNYVWNQQEASRFVESLLLGLPVPGVFLVKEKGTNKLLVIDGQQRLKTLQFFYSGFFSPKDDSNTKQVFKLARVQKKFEGRTYATLDEEDRIRLNDALVHATIVNQESPKGDDTSIYHIFDRLNSKGRLLTPQEIRTAIDHGPFIDMLGELNVYKYWRDIYGKVSIRLKDQELILRFFALYFESDEYESPMTEFLNRFAAKHQRADAAFLSECYSLFTKTIDAIWQGVGDRAFKPQTTLNAAVYDSVMVGLAHRIQSMSTVDYRRVQTIYNGLLEDGDYMRLVSRATSNERNVEARINKATEEFSKV